MSRFEIHKPTSKAGPVRKDGPLPKDSKFVWIYHRLPLHDVSKVEAASLIIKFLEEKLETEALGFVMGTPDMPQWLFKWIR